MKTDSSRRGALLVSILAIASMSFLAGIFFISGVRVLTGGGWEYAIAWALIPFIVVVAVLHARKILNLR